MNSPKKAPGKVEISAMEPFAGVGLDRILLVRDANDAAIAFEDLSRGGPVGFDTESKPVFFKGQKSEGPHVLQFATADKAYIFQSHVEESLPVLIDLLSSPEIEKIGFGLKGDLQQIFQRFAIRPAAIVELDRSFKSLGYRDPIGTKSAIAILFQRKLQKSKSVTTSNWASKELSPSQLLYAANDAYAALKVYHALKGGGHWVEP